MKRHPGEHIIFDDFNVVRDALERFGTYFGVSKVNEFNAFIYNFELCHVMGGSNFNKVNRQCNKMRKLDCFHISEGAVENFLNLIVSVIMRVWSDHCPIFMKNELILWVDSI